MGLEIVGDVGDQGSGGDNGDEAQESAPDGLTQFVLYDLSGQQVVFLEMPFNFEGLSELEMALHIEWNLTRTRNQVNGLYLSQHNVAIPDMVLLDKRMGFLIQWVVPSALDRLRFEIAWEQELGGFIDAMKDNLAKMILTQGVQGAEEILRSGGQLNRQQRREMEREQLRRMHRGN